MKNLMKSVLAIALFMLSVATFAQEVPANVKATFTKKHPKATQVKWKLNKKGNWRAAYINAGKNKARAIYKTDGVEIKVVVFLKNTPGKIKQHVDSTYAGYKIVKTRRITKAKKMHYVVTVEKDGVKNFLKYTNSQTFVKELTKKEQPQEN